ncbi:hypothetical protein AAFF_G00095050 [Aldrovandia affinis]|uniref:Uncharacterized protein n=1 Tax=Aldrovandia affinis TaxID=143900 RepID=A0AAD7RVS3_9TELE|nr:hypothetical protein AAFF_G00095050 [Aldrovandia affinis]
MSDSLHKTQEANRSTTRSRGPLLAPTQDSERGGPAFPSRDGQFSARAHVPYRPPDRKWGNVPALLLAPTRAVLAKRRIPERALAGGSEDQGSRPVTEISRERGAG